MAPQQLCLQRFECCLMALSFICQIKTWFQNRRMKLKREMQDYGRGFPPSFSLSHQPQVPSALFQDFSEYPHGPPKQSTLLPYSPDLLCSLYNPPQTTAFHVQPYHMMSLHPVTRCVMNHMQPQFLTLGFGDRRALYN